MNKFSLFITLMSLAGLITLAPLSASAQTDEAQAEFERVWYDTCYTKKDVEKCYQQSKELVEKYGKSQYAENAKTKIRVYDQNKAWEKFQAAFDAYYKPPQDAAKLEALFAAGDEFLKIEPDKQAPSHLFALGQMALAGHQASIGRIYDKLDRVKDYIEQAMTAFENARATEKTKKDFDLYVAPLKDLVTANGNQFLGFRLSETKGDQAQTLEYLGKAIQVKGKDGVGWKDPYNYFLRAIVYNTQYLEARKPYEAMTDEQKVGDAGKEALKKINEVLDTKLIPEYARVLATATGPNGKTLYDLVKTDFDNLWKFRTDAPDKAADYVKNYVNDPTIANVPVPAKAEDTSSLATPATPTAATTSAVKLQASGPASAPGGADGGGKATADKKGAVKSKRRGRG